MINHNNYFITGSREVHSQVDDQLILQKIVMDQYIFFILLVNLLILFYDLAELPESVQFLEVYIMF